MMEGSLEVIVEEVWARVQSTGTEEPTKVKVNKPKLDFSVSPSVISDVEKLIDPRDIITKEHEEYLRVYENFFGHPSKEGKNKRVVSKSANGGKRKKKNMIFVDEKDCLKESVDKLVTVQDYFKNVISWPKSLLHLADQTPPPTLLNQLYKNEQ